MNKSRRKCLVRALALCAAPGLSWQAATAQLQWPSKPIRLVNAWPPGSPPDTYARIYAERMSKSLGVAVVVDNKPGAAGNIGTESVARSAADGYTLLYTVSNAFTVNPVLYRKLPFDAEKDMKPVAPILAQGGFIVVNNDLPVKSMKELVAYAKQHPAKLAYASYGTGGFPHLMIELVKDTAQVQMLHVPYKSGPMTDLISGQVQLMLEPAASAIPMIKTGRVRAIAFSGAKRHAQFPDLPTVAETYPGVVGWGWHGIWAPAGVPDEIVRRLNAEVNRITQSPEVAKQVAELGSESLPGTPETMAAMVDGEGKVWGGLIRSKNIMVD
ncbi:MAG: tripartite tricarboxylate transporter substrate binding protein [Variovorax sp.]|nr:MAG: tripartite tricarboxylate transporter substrate binding protein [Variovorax sp.]